jgi:hypothetical protein
MTGKPNKWRIKSARTIYNNRWIMVREYETVAPTGADAQYGLVHLHNLALGVLPIDENGDTILIGQERTCTFPTRSPTSGPMPSWRGASLPIKALRRTVQKNYRFEEFPSQTLSEWLFQARLQTPSPL